MTPREFCYWLQGHIEIGEPKALTEEQVKMIKRHLDLVFTNVSAERDRFLDNKPFQPHDRIPLDFQPTWRGVPSLGTEITCSVLPTDTHRLTSSASEQAYC